MPSDVARLMEAIFGARMALRQQQVRATIGVREMEHLLRESGLQTRDRASSLQAPTEQVLAEFAPLVPRERSGLRTGLRGTIVRLRWQAIRWRNVTAVAAGIAVGILAALAIVSSRTRRCKVLPRPMRPPP
jgi:hypothetical protein